MTFHLKNCLFSSYSTEDDLIVNIVDAGNSDRPFPLHCPFKAYFCHGVDGHNFHQNSQFHIELKWVKGKLWNIQGHPATEAKIMMIIMLTTCNLSFCEYRRYH